MSAPKRLAPLAAAALGLALGAACGDTLVDHRNTAVRDAGNGLVCEDTTTVACFDEAQQQNVCRQESETACGTACDDCTAGTIPTGGQAWCNVPADVARDGHGTCDYECTGGLLKCAGGCCAATQVAAGDGHTCAVTAGGGVACWGANEAGQTGAPASATPRRTPVRAITSGATAVAAGRKHTCALVSGAVRCWGDNAAGQAPATVAGVSGATALAAGQSHTCALVAGGAVKCWGASDRLGAAITNGIATPVASGATVLTAGWDHTCALVGGGVTCWGLNAGGQLGTGGTTASAVPVTPTGLGSGVAALDAGRNFTCAAMASPVEDQNRILNAVLCWGTAPGWNNAFGFAVTQTTPKVPLKDENTATVKFGPIAKLAAGRTHVCVAADGEGAKCFGSDNSKGQLGGTPAGIGEPADASIVAPGAGFVVGGDHGCTLAADGVHCWGDNSSGQLGDGTSATPTTGASTTVSGR